MAVVNMFQQHEGNETDGQIASTLRCIGIRTLDSSIFEGKDMVGIHRALERYIHPLSVGGIVKALTNSFHDELSNIALFGRMSARFQFVDKDTLDLFRNYLCDTSNIHLGEDDIRIIRSMPIFEVYGHERSHEFSAISRCCYVAFRRILSWRYASKP